MSYSLTTGISYFEHIQTISTIEKSGRQIETAIHSGLMSLATSQAKAMEEFGTKVDDRLVEINDTINSCFTEIKFCLDGISEQLGHGFTAMNDRLADIDKTLARLDDSIANPEATRARERFHHALDLYKAGFFAPALEHVDHAIGNDGGPSFGHVSEYQALKGTLHMGSPTNPDKSVIDPGKAHNAFVAAARYYAIKDIRDRPDRADLYYQAGLAAYAAGNPMAAIKAHREALEDYEAASHHPGGRNPCFAHFQIARSGLANGDDSLVRRHLVQAIDMNWKLLVAVAADPDCIAHRDIVEPIVSDYVKETLPQARREIEALCFILIGGAHRNISKMHQNIRKATLPEDLQGDTSHRRPESFEEMTRFSSNPLQRYWNSFSIFSPYPAGLTDDQSRVIKTLLRDDVGLLDIAVAMERLDSGRALSEPLDRTREYWRRINSTLKCGIEQFEAGRLPYEMLPSGSLHNVPREPQLETRGGLLARRRAKNNYEAAVAERKRAVTAAYDVLDRDLGKVAALARKELPGVLKKCKIMVDRSNVIQQRADRALKTLHPERRWKIRNAA